MKSKMFFLFLLYWPQLCDAQQPNCPNNSIYILAGGQIVEQSILLPAVTNTLLTNLPTSAAGLAVGPALGFPAPSPTFWTVSGGTYWYFNGSVWVNTNHFTGNAAALNIGAGGSCLYNLIGTTGQIYVYTGTGNGTLLTTVNGFNGGGPYDIAADLNDNFYLVKAIGPNPSLNVYDPKGNSICSYSLINLPSVANGGGFAINNNLIAVHNNGLSVGSINPASTIITFTTQPPYVSPNDFANCVLPVPSGQIIAPMGSVLDCTNNMIPLIAQVVPGGIGMLPGPPSSLLTSSSYSWAGPGIVSGQNTASITVNQPGVYTFSVYSNGCPAQQVVKSYTITSIGAALTPTIIAPPCVAGIVTLSVSLYSPVNGINWFGPGILGSSIASTVLVNSPGVYSVTVTNTFGCSGTETVSLSSPPILSIALSASSVCAQGFFGSPNSLTISPSGASFYTLMPSTNFVSNSQVPWVCSPAGAPTGSITASTFTVVGYNGVCTASAVSSFSIIPNPTVSITPAVSSVCSGMSKTLNVSGATNYSWSPGIGLNNYSGNSVVASTSVSAIYSAFGTQHGCNSALKNSTLTILPIPTIFVSPPSTTVCSGNNANLSAAGTATFFSWSSSAGISGLNGANININTSTSTSWTVVGTLNSCTNSATASVFAVPPPIISMAFTSNTVCAQPFNGSPNSIAVTAFGALNYTLLSGSGYTVAAGSGSGFTIVPLGLPQINTAIATVTLLGSNGYCQVASTRTFSIVPNPLINSAPSNAIICPGESIALLASGANNFYWSSNNSALPNNTGNSISVNPTGPVIYSVIGERQGCWSIAQVNVIGISPVPQVIAAISSPTICSGLSASLKAYGNATDYQWLQSNGSVAGTGANVLVTPTISQTYTVIGTLNNCLATSVISLTVVPSPIIVASASDYTICSGSTIHLYVNGAVTYNWAPATVVNSTVGQHITAAPAGNTTFTVLGFNGICTGSTSLRIKTIPIPNVIVNASYNQICVGGSVPLNVIGAQNFIWSPAQSLSSNTGAHVVASPAITTDYTIRGLNSEGAISCPQEISFLLTVIPKAKAIVSSNKSICFGDKVGLSVLGGDSYSWKPANDLNKSNGSSVIAQPTISTVYFVESSFNGNCPASNTIAVTVNPKPWVDASTDTLYNLDETMIIQANGSGTLKWIAGENIFCNDCAQTKVAPKMNSCYRVEVTNEFGCKAYDDVCITVTDNFYEYIPNSFSPNADGLNDLFLIYGTGLSNVSMFIYDRWGKQIFSSNEQNKGWDGTYNEMDCLTGVYTYKIAYTGLSGKNFEKVGSVTLIR